MFIYNILLAGGNSTINIFGGDDSYNHYKQPGKPVQQSAPVQQQSQPQSAKPVERSTRPW